MSATVNYNSKVTKQVLLAHILAQNFLLKKQLFDPSFKHQLCGDNTGERILGYTYGISLNI